MNHCYNTNNMIKFNKDQYKNLFNYLKINMEYHKIFQNN